jgi:hypothetical protein
VRSRAFLRTPAAPDTKVRLYHPTSAGCWRNIIILTVGVGGALWFARNTADHTHWLATGAWVLAAVLMVTGLVYVLTVRVAIDARTITRTWLGGRRTIVLEEIGQLGLSQYKRTVSLVIRQRRKRFMALTSDTFDWQDIRCMHRDILLALGLDTQPMWPGSPRHVGSLDVEQVLRYKRFQAEMSGH